MIRYASVHRKEQNTSKHYHDQSPTSVKPSVSGATCIPLAHSHQMTCHRFVRTILDPCSPCMCHGRLHTKWGGRPNAALSSAATTTSTCNLTCTSQRTERLHTPYSTLHPVLIKTTRYLSSEPICCSGLHLAVIPLISHLNIDRLGGHVQHKRPQSCSRARWLCRRVVWH